MDEKKDRYVPYHVLYCISDNYFDPVYGYQLLSVWVDNRMQKTLKFLGPDLELAMDYITLLNAPFAAWQAAEAIDDATWPSINGYTH